MAIGVQDIFYVIQWFHGLYTYAGKNNPLEDQIQWAIKDINLLLELPSY